MKLEVGKRIFHEKFGVGTVTLIDNDIIVQINFNGEEKRLMIKYATFHEPSLDQLSQISIKDNKSIEFIDHSKKQESLSANEIKELESYFKNTLPTHYRSFLMNFPSEISHFKREYCNAKELLTERYFRNSVKSIIKVNNDFEAFELKDLIALGDDGCGNYFAIKNNDEDKNVYFIDHEGYRDNSINKNIALSNENFERLVKIEANSLKEYGQKIIKDSIKFYNSK